jgi:tetratricopeptide (TPR) repeat protein
MSVLLRTGREVACPVPGKPGRCSHLSWLTGACSLFWLAIATGGAPIQAANYLETSALFRTGKYAECAGSAEKAIAADEFSENLRLLKIKAEMELGRYAEALQTLDAALQKFPTSLSLRWVGRDVCRYNNQPERTKQFDDEMVLLIKQGPARYGDSINRLIVGRFFLSQGVDPKRVLDGLYNEVKKQQPNLSLAWLASGDLALDKQDFALAAQAFQQAAKLDPGDPEAWYGLARSFSSSDSAREQEAVKNALERNPNHIGTLLLLVDDLVDSERYDDAETLLRQVAEINPRHARAAAYRAVIAHLRSQPDVEKQQHQAALKFWPANPEVDHLIGKKLSQKYRFAEGAQDQRAALMLDAQYLPAKMQLAQDLLRLGQEDEGWKLAEEVFRTDEYSVVAHNLATLQENIAKFRTLEADGFIVRMEAREAEIYGSRVLDLLQRAKQTLCAKYRVTLDKPVIVEIFAKQQDFAIRTFGLPGGAGFLGVCFGTVITANSPASQAEHPTCWESTLWHEFCHVVTLNKTHNRMPRWLSEGISVYEERQADPTWGQALNPRYRKMILGDDLTAVSRLSSAFLNAASAQHLQFAYFESALVVEHLVEKYGIETLQKILVDLGAGVTINDALERHAGDLVALDAEFADFARKRAQALAPEADWSDPELPRRADSSLVAKWVAEHPNNYAGVLRLARQFISEKQWESAKKPLETLRKLYPGDESADGPLALLATVHRELGETREERAVLNSLAELSDDNVDVFARLCELTAEAGEWDLLKKYALRWLAVSPLQPAPHRRAAEAARKLQDDSLAAASYEALLRLDPIDSADLHLRLAGIVERQGNLAGARRHALLALEEAPRFRAAHRRLLEITRRIDASGDKPAEDPGKRPPPKKKPAAAF